MSLLQNALARIFKNNVCSEKTPCLLNVNIQVLFLFRLQKFKVPASIGLIGGNIKPYLDSSFSQPNNLHMRGGPGVPITFANNSRDQEVYVA